MGLVLWIDQNTFASSLIEKVFKKKALPFYTIDSVKDFSYLVEDLAPVLIVLDGATFLQNPEAFMQQYSSSVKMQALPFLILEGKGDLSFIKNKIGELKKPVVPFELPETIVKFLAAN